MNTHVPAEVDSAANERALQMTSAISMAAGAVGALVIVLVAFLWRIITGGPMPYEIVVLVLDVAGAAVGFALLERINRPTRGRTAQLADCARDADRRLMAIERDIQAIQGAVACLPEIEDILRRMKPDLAEKLERETTQAWYTGYAKGAQDQLRPTGTNGGGTGDVLRIHRNRPPSQG